MKSLTLIVSIILVLSISNIAAAPHNNTKENPQKQHTFLVKTDLTKEQVELLLNQYHQNKNQHRNQGEITNLKHQAPEVPEPPEPPEAPESPEMPEVENENEAEAVSFKKNGNKKKEKNEASEGPKTQEVSEIQEVPEAENKNETEKIDLKKTGIEKEKEKEKIKRIGMPQIPDSSETTNGNNDQTIIINLKKKGNDKKEKTVKTEKPQTNESSEVTVGETETDTVILVSKNNAKQSGSIVIEFISVIILTIVFVSFFIYVTQPKKTDKKNKNKNSFNELTYYLKVKGN